MALAPPVGNAVPLVYQSENSITGGVAVATAVVCAYTAQGINENSKTEDRVAAAKPPECLPLVFLAKMARVKAISSTAATAAIVNSGTSGWGGLVASVDALGCVVPSWVGSGFCVPVGFVVGDVDVVGLAVPVVVVVGLAVGDGIILAVGVGVIVGPSVGVAVVDVDGAGEALTDGDGVTVFALKTVDTSSTQSIPVTPLAASKWICKSTVPSGIGPNVNVARVHVFVAGRLPVIQYAMSLPTVVAWLLA